MVSETVLRKEGYKALSAQLGILEAERFIRRGSNTPPLWGDSHFANDSGVETPGIINFLTIEPPINKLFRYQDTARLAARRFIAIIKRETFDWKARSIPASKLAPEIYNT